MGRSRLGASPVLFSSSSGHRGGTRVGRFPCPSQGHREAEARNSQSVCVTLLLCHQALVFSHGHVYPLEDSWWCPVAFFVVLTWEGK